MRRGKVKYGGMVGVVLNWLRRGNEITAIEAVKMWNELNVRNKISILRERGWPIRSREERNPTTGAVYKVYYLDMDRTYWPHDEEAAAS